MDDKIKELIAIGASITGHCQPCLKYHIEQAVKLGIGVEEINTAIAIGKTVEKGAFKAMDNFAKTQIADLNPTGDSKNCGCAELNCCLSDLGQGE